VYTVKKKSTFKEILGGWTEKKNSMFSKKARPLEEKGQSRGRKDKGWPRYGKKK